MEILEDKMNSKFKIDSNICKFAGIVANDPSESFQTLAADSAVTVLQLAIRKDSYCKDLRAYSHMDYVQILVLECHASGFWQKTSRRKTRMNRLFIGMLAMVIPLQVLAEDIMVHRGEIATVPINPRLGTLIEFPRSIQVVSDTEHYLVSHVATEIDKKSQKPVNVNIVKVKPRRSGSIEDVPFVLTGKKTVTLRFITVAGAPKHHRIKFPAPYNREMASSGRFLENEVQLMKFMLQDKQGKGFSREVVRSPLKIDGYGDKVDIEIVRRYEGQRLFGYVFKLTNTSDEKITVNPHALNFGTPNRAALMQIDHELMEPCSVNNSPNPKSNSCVTALRLVVRGEDYVHPSKQSDLPFMISKRR